MSFPDPPAGGSSSRPTPPGSVDSAEAGDSADIADIADAEFVHSVIARLVGGDPLAPVLIRAAAEGHPGSFAALSALAVIGTDPEDLRRARLLARTRRERQHAAIIEESLTGDPNRARVLAREHLAEFPDDIVISWLVGTR